MSSLSDLPLWSAHFHVHAWAYRHVQVVQLTSLRPTADLFCSLLRDALKVELQKGNMKAVKGFVKTCYSEMLVTNASASENVDEKGAEAPKADDASAAESMYLGGLGLKFKFPGDPKK